MFKDFEIIILIWLILILINDTMKVQFKLVCGWMIQRMEREAHWKVQRFTTTSLPKINTFNKTTTATSHCYISLPQLRCGQLIVFEDEFIGCLPFRCESPRHTEIIFSPCVCPVENQYCFWSLVNLQCV